MTLQKGFTLIELMVVVVVIGILAAVAIPSYSDYVVRGKLVEASTFLSSLRVRMEQYYQDNRTYQLPAGGCGVGMPLAPTVKYFTLGCVAPTADTYIITATATSTGGVYGFVFNVNQFNAKDTTSVPAGWTTSTTCWVTKRGGAC